MGVEVVIMVTIITIIMEDGLAEVTGEGVVAVILEEVVMEEVEGLEVEEMAVEVEGVEVDAKRGKIPSFIVRICSQSCRP